MLTLLRGSNLSGLLTDENATRICSTTISQFAKSRRELSSCEATSLRLPPFFDLDTVTLASGGGAPLCVFQDPGVWIWDLHRTRSAMGWEGRGGWTKRCLYQVGRWFLGGRGAGVRCIRDKKRGPCTVSGARTPSIEREEGGEGFFPFPLATTATKTENVVKLRNILSTLFTSEDKDRRPSLGPCPASSRSGLRCKRHGARFQAKRPDKKLGKRAVREWHDSLVDICGR